MKRTIDNLMGERRLTASITGSGRKILFIFFLFILLFLLAAISVAVGPLSITVTEVYSIILQGLFQNPETKHGMVVWEIRILRMLMGIVAGIALGLAGTIIQGVLKNPLASPFTLGIAAGAGFGAVIAVILGVRSIPITGGYIIMGSSFLLAFIIALFILYLANRIEATPFGIVVIVLVGIAIMWLFAPLNTVVLYLSEVETVKEAMFWSVGSLGRTSVDKLKFVIAPILLACFVFLFSLLIIRKLSDFDAVSIGVKPENSPNAEVKHTRILLMAIASIFVATTVSFTGAIAFIGLVAPHIAYKTVGKDNRFLLPTSALLGALILVGADTLARTIMAPVIIPVGVVTSLIGVPLFIYLLINKNNTRYFEKLEWMII